MNEDKVNESEMKVEMKRPELGRGKAKKRYRKSARVRPNKARGESRQLQSRIRFNYLQFHGIRPARGSKPLSWRGGSSLHKFRTL